MRKGRIRSALFAACLLTVACGGAEEAPPAEEAAEGEDLPVDYVVEGVWSPRGDRLMVTWEQGGRQRLYGVLAPDTTGSAQAVGTGLRVSDGPDGFATWSPDGNWVAFGSTRDGQGEIYRMRPDGMQLERLTDDPAEDMHPAFSPDGSRIAFVSTRTDGAPRLHIMDADGGNVLMVGSPPGLAHSHPAWDPVADRLAVQVSTEEGEQIFLATPSGGWGRVKAGTSPSWHPNGDDIFLARNDSILVARVSSGSLRLNNPNGSAPAVSPDGRWLAVVRGEYPTSALWVIDLETGSEHRATRE